jgi:hypothetical protein
MLLGALAVLALASDRPLATVDVAKDVAREVRISSTRGDDLPPSHTIACGKFDYVI